MDTFTFLHHVRSIAEGIDQKVPQQELAERAKWLIDTASLRLLTRLLGGPWLPCEFVDPMSGERTGTLRPVAAPDMELRRLNAGLVRQLEDLTSSGQMPQPASLRDYCERVRAILDAEAITSSGISRAAQKLDQDDAWKSAAELAKLTGVHRGTIKRAADEGRLQCRGSGRDRRISLASFMKWQESRGRIEPPRTESVAAVERKFSSLSDS